ncbi:MAG: thymidine phosphorylase family protein [Bauldia sp.]|nr:thymidine phosphorylase family protein [Bauldia sp.]
MEARRRSRAREGTILKARRVPIDSFRENVLLLSRQCTMVRPERLTGTRKVEVRSNGRAILATILIVDDPGLVAQDEAGLAEPAFRRLGVAEGALVEIAPAPRPKGLAAIEAKVSGQTLTDAVLADVVSDLVGYRWSDVEISAFLVACASFMTADETLAFTRAMTEGGTRLDWNTPIVADKHCIGGIPGNRTSLVVVPIVAAHGLTIPKTSSRAITSPAGTADTMEVLARVDLSIDEMRATVDRCGGCIVWGGRVNLSPADDVLISVERRLSIDTPEQMVASILSKKIAAGSTHMVLDVPVGPTAKIRDPHAALRLRKLFEFVAGRLGIALDIVITDGAQPVGRGIGPVLEMRDVLAVLRNETGAPADLREKSIRLAARLLEMDPAVRGGTGEARARELLVSGAALAKLEQIAGSQGAPRRQAVIGSLVAEIRASKSGWVQGIDCLRIARIARTAGAPTDPGAGIELLLKQGDSVRAGDPLYRVYGDDPADFGMAVASGSEEPGYLIG